MKVEVFILGLPNFKDDRIVFEHEELEKIKGKIGCCLCKNGILKEDWEAYGGWHVYRLNPDGLYTNKRECSEKPYIEKSDIFDIKSAELGYYHHRVIVHFNLDLKDYSFHKEDGKGKDKFLVLRDVRKKLKDGIDEIIDDCITKEVKRLTESKEIGEEGEIEFMYTYSLIIVKSEAEKHEPVFFSEETTSLCFEIIEPRSLPLPSRKHLMRISIPSTILYVKKGVGRSLLRDIINSIYQHCLYEKKGKDNKKVEEVIKKKKNVTEEEIKDIKKKIYENRLDEDILVKLWTHILDTMGGESADVHIARIESTNRFLTFIAIIISVFTFILGFILSNILQNPIN
ncbi:MAG: hypothetical protein PVF58_13090 [Candidatus Methanofastidiosia archaeon]|jgi:hypothetical protein